MLYLEGSRARHQYVVVRVDLPIRLIEEQSSAQTPILRPCKLRHFLNHL
jgi:hypothetical protein